MDRASVLTLHRIGDFQDPSLVRQLSPPQRAMGSWQEAMFSHLAHGSRATRYGTGGHQQSLFPHAYTFSGLAVPIAQRRSQEMITIARHEGLFEAALLTVTMGIHFCSVALLVLMLLYFSRNEFLISVFILVCILSFYFVAEHCVNKIAEIEGLKDEMD